MGPSAVRILALSQASRRAAVSLGPLHFRCALGRTGTRSLKREGDGATPIGTWHPINVFYRADRIARPRTALALSAIRATDGWCDAPADRNYNRFVRRPYAASAETLWRDDHLYDIVVVLDHNRTPRKRNCGSAIFMHLARPAYKPTEGCIALNRRDLHRLLARLTRRTRIEVHATPRPVK